ncbi:MAG: hypothetical protein Q4P32_11680 [Micrococcales bacterium]|nr:hypothetical protein [Micrococcales bacterium]
MPVRLYRTRSRAAVLASLILALAVGSAATGCAGLRPRSSALGTIGSPYDVPGSVQSAEPAELPGWVPALLTTSPALRWSHRVAGADVVVLGGGPSPDLTEIERMGREAIATLEREWLRPWPQRLLIVAPADRAQLAQVAKVPADRLADSAAMAIRGPGTGSYIVLDPVAWSQATTAGRRALLVHEAVHVAVAAQLSDPPSASATAKPAMTAATTADSVAEAAPPWLSEGFAQDVAYRAIGVQPRDVAAGLLQRIALDGPPTRLPDAADLMAVDSSREDAYALAWLVVRTLRRLGGSDAARRVQEAGSLATVGITSSELLRAWQEDLRQLAPSQ